MERLKRKMVSRILYLVWALGIVLLAYFPGRDDFTLLTLNFAVVFLCYWLIIDPSNKIRLKSLLLVAVITRIAIIPATPTLSDDMYRYVWDGQISLSLENPYEKKPSEWMEQEEIPRFLDTTLYSHLNSQEYYSVYPPFTQLFFATGTLIARTESGGAVFWTKSLIVLTEITLLFIIVPLLRRMGKDPGMVAIYAFNPLVLIEISGNMHLEGISILFLALALMYYQGKKGIRSGTMLGLSVGAKLTPFILLPVMALATNFKQWFSFALAAVAMSALLLSPLLVDQAWMNFSESLRLYFQTFEFNASFYYLFSFVGEWIKGYNWIAVIGPFTSGVFLILYLISLYLIKRKRIPKQKIPEVMMLVLTIFFLFQTTVHPWYILPLVLLAALTGWRYPIVWSGIIFLSYHAYSSTPYGENLWVTAISYAVLFASAWWLDRKKMQSLWNHSFTKEKIVGTVQPDRN
jgi:alpha-1,6-mannosyltransferase